VGTNSREYQRNYMREYMKDPEHKDKRREREKRQRDRLREEDPDWYRAQSRARDARRIARHGIAHTSYQQMKQRCLNPKNPMWDYYGGRGIDIDPRWIESYEAFLADVGPRPSLDYTLDRIDNNRGYWPDNVRWATRSEQQRNKRPYTRKKTSGRKIEVTRGDYGDPWSEAA
jgi:hypothetical protein